MIKEIPVVCVKTKASAISLFYPMLVVAVLSSLISVKQSRAELYIDVYHS